MGDMADYTNSSGMGGTVTWYEGLSEVTEDLDTGQVWGLPPAQSSPACRSCGYPHSPDDDGLRWQQRPEGWRLVTDDGSLHVCLVMCRHCLTAGLHFEPLESGRSWLFDSEGRYHRCANDGGPG